MRWPKLMPLVGQSMYQSNLNPEIHTKKYYKSENETSSVRKVIELM